MRRGSFDSVDSGSVGDSQSDLFPTIGLEPKMPYERFLSAPGFKKVASIPGMGSHGGSAMSLRAQSSTAPAMGMQSTSQSLNSMRGKLANQVNSVKSVSGSQFRLLTRGQDNNMCMQCAQFSKVNRKMKEAIRSLKFQIQNVERDYHELKLQRGTSSVNTNTIIEPTSNTANVDDGKQADEDEDEDSCENCTILREELKNAKRLMQYERTSNEGLRKAFFELRGSLEGDIMSAKSEVFKMETDLNQIRNDKLQVERENSQIKRSLTSYKENLTKTQTKLSECEIRLRSSGANANANIDHLKEIEKLRDLLQKEQAIHLKSKAAVDEVQKVVSAKQEEIEILKSSLYDREREKEFAEKQISVLEEENRAANDAFNKEKNKIVLLEVQIKNYVQEKENYAARMSEFYKEIKENKTSISTLQVENSSLLSRISDLKKQIVHDTMNNKKTIEKAITGSVKLCVVAPTVNVHVANKKMKCRAGISEAALKQFLNKEILERYSFLYKQKQDNSAPDGGSLESFLQQMLQQMQESIEQHVNSAMDGSQ